MSKQDNSGPAFPIPLNAGQSWQGMAPCDGMTLRDYFASKAMTGYVSSDSWRIDIDGRSTAKAAYAMADYMLKAREA